MIGNEGRMLLRPSGTENLVRLLIEHKDDREIEKLSNYFYGNINKEKYHSMKNNKYLIVANWKQNGDLKSLTKLVNNFIKLHKKSKT